MIKHVNRDRVMIKERVEKKRKTNKEENHPETSGDKNMI